MSSLRSFLWRCREFFQKKKLDAEMAEQIREHVERMVEQNVAAGMSTQEARYAAQRKFGNAGLIQETARDQRGWIWLEQFIQDFRYASRSLWKAPLLSSVVILTLALGIGASATIFSVVNTVILRPLPFPAAEQLVAVRVVIPAYARIYPTVPVSARFYKEWRNCPAFSGLALIDRNQGTLTGNGEPLRVSVVHCSANLFTMLRVAPRLGRTFAPGEDDKDESSPVVLSDHAWRDRFSADPQILGRTLTVDQHVYTVIGVLPENFRLPESRQFLTGKTAIGEPEIFLPKKLDPHELNEINGWFNYEVIGRLAEGYTVNAAIAQINVIAARLSTLSGEIGFEARGFIAPLHESIVGPSRHGLFLLLGAIISVLLIACLNLSLLMLARAERQNHEGAVRSALGATRRRLLRRSLVESLILSFTGGALGLIFGLGGLKILIFFAPADLPRLEAVRLDPAMLGFALGATLLATLSTGLIPAWRAARADPSSAFRGSASRGATGNASARRLRHLLVVIEVGVTTVLLATAALLATSFSRLVHIDSGLHAPATISTQLAISYVKYNTDAARISYHERLLAEIRSTPGVVAAAIATALPLQGETWIDNVWTPGDTRPKAERPNANVRFISADFFETLGIPLLAGRTFRDSDKPIKTAILSAQLAGYLWPGQNPLGRKIMTWGNEEFEVIGISGDVRASADQRPASVIYKPFWANPPANVFVLVKIEGSLTAMAPALRAAIHRVDTEVPIETFQTMDDILMSSVAQRRFQLRLVIVFSLSAIMLAGLGIYGVVSHGVAQRARELGIRLAFGANPGSLHRLVLRQGLMPAAWGLCSGMIAAIAGGRLLSGLLFETGTHDPSTLAAVVIILAVVAVLSCWIPARRATKIQPMVALRIE